MDEIKPQTPQGNQGGQPPQQPNPQPKPQQPPQEPAAATPVQKPAEQPAGKGRELTFDVMPELAGGGAKTAPAEARKPEPGEPKAAKPAGPGGGKRTWRIAVISIAVIIVVGVLGYFIYSKFFSGSSQGDENNILVPQEDRDIIIDVDTDEDGLSDDNEATFGTKADDPDTDRDGLADGDELFVYGSDPLLQDTDGDGFDDGGEVARGYSPTSDSADRASQAVLDSWQSAIEEFGLHEPTNSTLILKQEGADSGETSLYENLIYGYEFQLPALLQVREEQQGRSVGLYVAGTTPSPDTPIESSPISLAIAVKVDGQSLRDWLGATYVEGTDYQSASEVQADGTTGVRLAGMDEGVACDADRTFFASENTIVIAKLNCNEIQDFADLYTQVISSFKFKQ